MRTPKHATVVAYAALFVTMGGTAYAATGGTFVLGHSNSAGAVTTLKDTGTGAALKLQTEKSSTAVLSVSNGTKISNLNADRIDGLDSTALQRKVTLIRAQASAATGSAPAGKTGPWSFVLNCSGDGASIVIHGPGDVGGTTTLASGGNVGASYVGGFGPISTGATSSVSPGGQMSQDEFLLSGSTRTEIRLLLTASSADPFTACSVTGSATPLT